MKILTRLWHDEQGVVVTTDLVLISSILILGVIVGLTTMRDQVVQELGDLAAGIGSLNQSFSYAGTVIGTFSVAGSDFIDLADDCETGGENANSSTVCISLAVNSSHEQ